MLSHERVLANFVQRRECAYDDLAGAASDSTLRAQRTDVDDAIGRRDAEAHPIQQLRAARNVL
jgi:hypothetical protein